MHGRALVRDQDALLPCGADVRLRVERRNLSQTGCRHRGAARDSGCGDFVRVAQYAIQQGVSQRLCGGEKAEVERQRVDRRPLVVSVRHVVKVRGGRVHTPRAGQCVRSHIQHGRHRRHAHHVLGGIDGAVKCTVGQRSSRAEAVVRGQKLRNQEPGSGRIQRREIPGNIGRRLGRQHRILVRHPLAERTRALRRIVMIGDRVPVRIGVRQNGLIPSRIVHGIARVHKEDGHYRVGIGRLDGIAVRLHLGHIIGP